MKHILRLLFLMLMMNNTAFAQNSCIDFFSIGDVISITENGNSLWIGTSDNGLVSFDKTTFSIQYFDTTNTIFTSNEIEATCLHDGKLYISTENKLLAYANGIFSVVNDTISGLLIENQNSELVVVDVEMVYMLQNDQIIYQKNLETVPDARQDCCEYNTEITMDSSGNLWISRYAFYEFDILKFDGTIWTAFHSTNTSVLPIESYNFNGISSFQNTVFATSWGGLHQFEQGNWTNFYDFSAPIINGQDTLYPPLAAVHYENTGYLWIGTDGRDTNEPGRLLMYSFQDDLWHFISIIDSLPNIIREIQTDNSRIYVGTSNGLGVVEKWCYLIATNPVEIKNNPIRIFPNPATNHITIENPMNIEIQTIDFYDLNSRLIQTFLPSEQLDITMLPKGFYILRIKTEKEILTQKLWIE